MDNISKQSEAVTGGLFGSTVAVHRNILPIEGVLDIFLWCEANLPKGQNPWDSVYKIELLQSKSGLMRSGGASARDKVLWMVNYVNDKHVSQEVEKGEFAHRTMAGKGMAGNKGSLDYALQNVRYTIMPSSPRASIAFCISRWISQKN